MAALAFTESGRQPTGRSHDPDAWRATSSGRRRRGALLPLPAGRARARPVFSRALRLSANLDWYYSGAPDTDPSGPTEPEIAQDQAWAVEQLAMASTLEWVGPDLDLVGDDRIEQRAFD